MRKRKWSLGAFLSKNCGLILVPLICEDFDEALKN